MRGIWASMNVDLTSDEDSRTYLQEELTLIFASWEWKCHVVRIWKRSCISCSGSLLSKDYKAKPLILCRRCWLMCLCCSLNSRRRNRMQHLSGRHHVAVGLWQPRGPCPWWGPGPVIWGLPGTPTCRWQHLPVLWDVVPVPGIPVSLGNWKLKPRASHPFFNVNILLFYE